MLRIGNIVLVKTGGVQQRFLELTLWSPRATSLPSKSYRIEQWWSGGLKQENVLTENMIRSHQTGQRVVS